MYDNQTHKVGNQIVSLSQPHFRRIVRGKTKSPVEFGAKLEISVEDGYTRLEKVSFDAYNKATYLIEIIERYKERTGFYSARILADKIYRNRGNLTFCKERGIRLSGPALGRPPKKTVMVKKQDYRDMCERLVVERKFSLAKLKCGFGLIRTCLPEISTCTIALSIVVLNLRNVFYAHFRLYARIGRGRIFLKNGNYSVGVTLRGAYQTEKRSLLTLALNLKRMVKLILGRSHFL